MPEAERHRGRHQEVDVAVVELERDGRERQQGERPAAAQPRQRGHHDGAVRPEEQPPGHGRKRSEEQRDGRRVAERAERVVAVDGALVERAQVDRPVREGVIAEAAAGGHDDQEDERGAQPTGDDEPVADRAEAALAGVGGERPDARADVRGERGGPGPGPADRELEPFAGHGLPSRHPTARAAAGGILCLTRAEPDTRRRLMPDGAMHQRATGVR
jgi:hypothetical protein